jgi:hypothetical protein
VKNVYIPADKPCDIRPCPYPAVYDAPTNHGPWANMCDEHFESLRAPNAYSVGYRFLVGEEPVKSDEEKGREIRSAIESGDFDLAEDLIGDGDVSEWL